MTSNIVSVIFNNDPTTETTLDLNQLLEYVEETHDPGAFDLLKAIVTAPEMLAAISAGITLALEDTLSALEDFVLCDDNPSDARIVVRGDGGAVLEYHSGWSGRDMSGTRIKSTWAAPRNGTRFPGFAGEGLRLLADLVEEGILPQVNATKKKHLVRMLRHAV
ncbi:hypothetical protein GOC57_11365 [Sinorhizobium meliloti]|uniref:hypothetical protein n=1 Tax=Rhizobium meliloti TaxID=382 RepID=UPI001296A6F8|nr:hypothetical protein [Sinorhizobium meliloti]MDW9375265.1 hypothetical protein [Sinorhizobium meliloti]MDW9493891.1 hypothetical protein [Sinorhizobium meliloti]MDW9562125.1 hypothetical protein [Sinorhizobium meliloti]MDW9649669.1 hypothetical protein [Sinorhizobium meliloti]MDW9859505.1 hypothetical protein [Sinorhizobium meliloti]